MGFLFYLIRQISFESIGTTYIKGAHGGKICYEANNVPKSVKYYKYFDSLEECQKSL